MRRVAVKQGPQRVNTSRSSILEARLRLRRCRTNICQQKPPPLLLATTHRPRRTPRAAHGQRTSARTLNVQEPAEHRGGQAALPPNGPAALA